VYSILACIATVQGVAADVALVIIAVDFGTAAGDTAGSVVRAVGQYHRASVLLLRQRRRRTIKVAARTAV